MMMHVEGGEGGGEIDFRCRVVERAVAGAFRLPVSELRAPTRRRKEAARARQLAMYLAHVGLGLDYTTVGRMFGRDRTTVRHACALIEDARDDRDMDRALDGLEHVILVRLGAQEAGASAVPECRS